MADNIRKYWLEAHQLRNRCTGIIQAIEKDQTISELERAQLESVFEVSEAAMKAAESNIIDIEGHEVHNDH